MWSHRHWNTLRSPHGSTWTPWRVPQPCRLSPGHRGRRPARHAGDQADRLVSRIQGNPRDVRRIHLLQGRRRRSPALLSQEIVVGTEHAKPRRVASEPLPVVSEDDFLKRCDEHGKGVFSRILKWAGSSSMSINWGTKGFSVGVDVDEARVVVCYAYPPAAVFKQTLYTALHDRAGIERKTRTPAEAINRLRNAAEATRLSGARLRAREPVDDPADRPRLRPAHIRARLRLNGPGDSPTRP